MSNIIAAVIGLAAFGFVLWSGISSYLGPRVPVVYDGATWQCVRYPQIGGAMRLECWKGPANPPKPRSAPRRRFLSSIIALAAAPAIVRAGSLMPVKSINHGYLERMRAEYPTVDLAKEADLTAITLYDVFLKPGTRGTITGYGEFVVTAVVGRNTYAVLDQPLA